MTTTPVLAGFKLTRVLNEDAKTRTAALLGRFETPEGGGEEEAAIVLLEKTHFSSKFFETLGDVVDGDGLREEPAQKRLKTDGDADPQQQQLRTISQLKNLGQNDIYTWLLAWRRENPEVEADIKINLIRPATDAHVKKYEKQEKVMIEETPELYLNKVKPWLNSQPASRINWVYNILEGKKEVENVIHRNDDPLNGFIILPDLKWDQQTLSSLYLIAIVQDRSLRSLRDLTAQHIPLLENIQATASQVAFEKYSLGPKAKLRCFVHYQPSYYHLHVHILSSDFTSHPGAIVGQAHLLEDLIDLLKLGVDFSQRTLTYALGETHELLQVIRGS